MRFDDNSRRSYTILKINVWNTETESIEIFSFSKFALACVASVSVRFRRKERGTRVKDREKSGASKRAFWLSFHFSRGQNRKSPSLVFLCSETKRKRLLRRLNLLDTSCFAFKKFSTNLVYTLNLLHRIPSYRKWSLWTNRTVQGRQLFITLHKAGSSRSDLFLFPSSFIFLFLLFQSFPFHFFLQSVLLLLKNGTDPSIKNNKLETPLHLSARYSRHIKQQGYS